MFVTGRSALPSELSNESITVTNEIQENTSMENTVPSIKFRSIILLGLHDF